MKGGQGKARKQGVMVIVRVTHTPRNGGVGGAVVGRCDIDSDGVMRWIPGMTP